MSQNTAVVPFQFESKEVRTVTDESGNPWFVAKDVCNILDIQQPTKAVGNLDDDEVNKSHLVDSLGKSQEMITISESGLYTLIIRSNKPEAKKFRKWVTAEVLPAIRKTGTYTMPTAQMKNCSKCRKSLPIEMFQKDNRHRDGRHYYCRDCRRTIHQKSKQIPLQPTASIKNENETLLDKIFDGIDDASMARRMWKIFHDMSLVFIGRVADIEKAKNITDCSGVCVDELFARIERLEALKTGPEQRQ